MPTVRRLATDDIVEAMMRVEVAWMRALAQGGPAAADQMSRRSGEASATLLAERDGLGSSGRDADPASYLGLTGALVDKVLARSAARKASDG
jgi:hypothetical protein